MVSSPRFFLLLLLIPSFCQAQKRQPRIEWITDKQGISGPVINTMIKDSSGAIWLGTVDGLFRWNGREMDQFHHDVHNANTLPHNNINHLVEKDGNTLLLATSGGFSMYNKKENKWRNFSGRSGIGNRYGLRIFNDFVLVNDSIVILSHMYYGLYRLNLRTWQATYIDRSSFPGNLRYFQKLIRLRDGRIAGAGMGLVFIISEKLEILSVYQTVKADSNSLPFENQYLNISEDPGIGNTVWVGTWGGGLKKLELQTGKWSSYYFDDRKLAPNLHNIAADQFWLNDSTILIGNKNSFREYHVKTGSFTGTIWNDLKSPEGNNIKSVYRSKSGEEWVFSDHEVGRMNHKNPELTIYPWKNSNNNFTVIQGSSAERFEVFTWYGKRSYYLYDIRREQLLENHPIPFLDQQFTEIFASTAYNTRYLLNATRKGILVYDKRMKTMLPLPLSPACVQLKDKEISGIYPLSVPDEFIVYNVASGLWRVKIREGNTGLEMADVRRVKSAFVQSVHCQQNGRIYVGGESISVYDEEGNYLKRICRFNEEYRNGIINKIVEDEQHQLWITFDQLGLLRINLLNPTDIRILQRGKNTPSTFFDAIPDHNGGLWVISHQGLYRVSSFMKAYHYPTQRELKNITIQSYFIPLQDENWLFTGSEMIMLNASKQEKELPPCEIEIRDLMINGKEADSLLVSNKLRLDHFNNNFSMKVSTIDVDYADRVSYRYKMTGLDPEWVNIGFNNYISYANLAPGEYTLRLEAYDPETGMARGTKNILLEVVPAWYQKTAVKAGGFLVLILLATGGGLYINRRKYRIRLNELQKQKELEVMRQSISKDIHDELGSSITRITRSTELLLRQKDDREVMESQLSRLGDLSKSLGKSLNEIVWAVNPKEDKLENFVLFARQYLQELGEENNIEIRTQLPVAGLEMLLLPKAQRNLFLFLKEASNNAIKYSGTKLIELKIEADQQRDEFLISLTDTGEGFNPDQIRPFSNGLSNMRTRCEELGVNFNLSTAPGEGTTVSAYGSLSKLEQKSY
jgi:signal transduction histidine kinase/ligand-binding sensor domain-containing protein